MCSPVSNPISPATGNLSPSPARSQDSSEERIRVIIAQGVIFVPTEGRRNNSPVKPNREEFVFPPQHLICPQDQE